MAGLACKNTCREPFATFSFWSSPWLQVAVHKRFSGKLQSPSDLPMSKAECDMFNVPASLSFAWAGSSLESCMQVRMVFCPHCGLSAWPLLVGLPALPRDPAQTKPLARRLDLRHGRHLQTPNPEDTRRGRSAAGKVG